MVIFEEMGKVPVEVRDIMTPIVLSVDEDTPVRDIADIMMQQHLHRIFVTRDSKITGIITTYDMLKLVSDRELSQRCAQSRSEEHTSELQSRPHLVCRLLLEKKKKRQKTKI